MQKRGRNKIGGNEPDNFILRLFLLVVLIGIVFFSGVFFYDYKDNDILLGPESIVLQKYTNATSMIGVPLNPSGLEFNLVNVSRYFVVLDSSLIDYANDFTTSLSLNSSINNGGSAILNDGNVYLAGVSGVATGWFWAQQTRPAPFLASQVRIVEWGGGQSDSVGSVLTKSDQSVYVTAIVNNSAGTMGIYTQNGNISNIVSSPISTPFDLALVMNDNYATLLTREQTGANANQWIVRVGTEISGAGINYRLKTNLDSMYPGFLISADVGKSPKIDSYQAGASGGTGYSDFSVVKNMYGEQIFDQSGRILLTATVGGLNVWDGTHVHWRSEQLAVLAYDPQTKELDKLATLYKDSGTEIYSPVVAQLIWRDDLNKWQIFAQNWGDIGFAANNVKVEQQIVDGDVLKGELIFDNLTTMNISPSGSVWDAEFVKVGSSWYVAYSNVIPSGTTVIAVSNSTDLVNWNFMWRDGREAEGNKVIEGSKIVKYNETFYVAATKLSEPVPLWNLNGTYSGNLNVAIPINDRGYRGHPTMFHIYTSEGKTRYGIISFDDAQIPNVVTNSHGNVYVFETINYTGIDSDAWIIGSDNASDNFTAPVCIANITNTTWSGWTNVSCLSTNYTNQSRSRVQYDLNNCGGADVTIREYRVNVSCIYSNGQNNSNTSNDNNNQNTGGGIATCSDDCTFAKRECSGNGYRVCGNFDSDICNDWSSVVSCNLTSECVSGVCISETSFSNNSRGNTAQNRTMEKSKIIWIGLIVFICILISIIAISILASLRRKKRLQNAGNLQSYSQSHPQNNQFYYGQ